MNSWDCPALQIVICSKQYQIYAAFVVKNANFMYFMFYMPSKRMTGLAELDLKELKRLIKSSILIITRMSIKTYVK